MDALRLPSDIGGTRLGAPIVRDESSPAGYALRADGVRRALRNHGLWRSDPGRRATEELGHDLYERLDYYQRRVLAMEAVIVERGLVAPEDLAPRPAHLVPPPVDHERPVDPDDPPETSGPPRFAVGEQVRVRDDWPTGHVRTPWYVRGRTGHVTAVTGPFRNPETLAYFGTGRPALWLYQVEFAQVDLWEDYEGSPRDRLTMDIYENWIAPKEADG